MVDQRAIWSIELKQSTLGSSVFPSIRDARANINLRFDFDEDDQIRLTVPVAAIHIDTDSRPELWFQATEWQLERLIDILNNALSRMRNVSSLKLDVEKRIK
jgi:uncharacterized protein YajQ (UPF0234 family)